MKSNTTMSQTICSVQEHFKGILSSFAHPQVVANLYEFLSSAKQKGRYFEE